MIRISIPLVYFFVLCCRFSQPLLSQWQNGNDHHGFYSQTRIENQPSLQWKFATYGAVRSTPAVTEGKIIVGSSDGYMYCLDRNTGKLFWKFDADGAINSTPIVVHAEVYFVNRTNTLFAVKISDGTLLWRKNLGIPLPYEWGFDYYVGSPAIGNGILYVGSADGHMYALSIKDGREVWKYRTSSMIRSTPAIDKHSVYFGNCAGKVFALNKKDGTNKWTFSTIGDTLDNDKFGFDRKAVIASPTVDITTLYIGGRDGFLYALEKSSGRLRWKYDDHVSWIISTAALTNGLLITGTSDGRFVNALHVNDGNEAWRFKTNGPVWASPAVAGNGIVAISSNDGYVYALDDTSGMEIWRFKIGPQIFSSTVLKGSNLYFGSDDGYVYALTTQHVNQKPIQSIKRAVFWMKDPIFQSFRHGMDLSVRDYFISEGYDFYDESDIKEFLLSRIHSDTASVVVFATNYFPPSIITDTLGSNVFREYLHSGGKVVILGMNPSAYQIDYEKKRVTAIDFSLSTKITGITYRYDDLRSHGGYYSSFITPQGKQWGLHSNFVGIAGMPLSDIDIPLAIDETGHATAWVKKFSERSGSGFVQLFITPDRLDELPEVQRVAEHGLR